MTRDFRYASLAILIWSVVLPSAAESRGEPKPVAPLLLNIRTYDYAHMPKLLLARAKNETSRILREAGVETNWVDCNVPGDTGEDDPACLTSPRPIDLAMRILPRKMARGLMKHYSEFGIAFTAEGEGFGRHVSIFYHRVDELATRTDASRALLLGHLMAHEVGHLLLGSNSHARHGIMHVPWDESEIERVSRGHLLFTEKQATTMRRQVARRIEAAQSAPVLALSR